MTLKFQNKYADFSDLIDLATIFDDEGILVAEGIYEAISKTPALTH